MPRSLWCGLQSDLVGARLGGCRARKIGERYQGGASRDPAGRCAHLHLTALVERLSRHAQGLYLDRVFCAGFACVIKGEDYLPGLSGKKGAIITTSGATAKEFKSGGTLRALRTIYDEGLMEFSGIEMVRHLYLDGIDPAMSRADGEQRLETVRRFVRQAF